MKQGIYVLFFSAFSTACAPRYQMPPMLPISILQISNPDQTQQWLEDKNNLTYKRDPDLHGEDFWAPCALTYALGGGDCEDYAICAAALLEGDIEKGYIVSAEHPDRDSAHAVFAYKFHGWWGINSNNETEFRRPYFLTEHQAITDSLRGKYTEYTIYDYSGVNIFIGNEDLEDKIKKRKIGTYLLK